LQGVLPGLDRWAPWPPRGVRRPVALLHVAWGLPRVERALCRRGAIGRSLLIQLRSPDQEQGADRLALLRGEGFEPQMSADRGKFRRCVPSAIAAFLLSVIIGLPAVPSLASVRAPLLGRCSALHGVVPPRTRNRISARCERERQSSASPRQQAIGPAMVPGQSHLELRSTHLPRHTRFLVIPAKAGRWIHI
jgi:hypothetical protein